MLGRLRGPEEPRHEHWAGPAVRRIRKADGARRPAGQVRNFGAGRWDGGRAARKHQLVGAPRQRCGRDLGKAWARELIGVQRQRSITSRRQPVRRGDGAHPADDRPPWRPSRGRGANVRFSSPLQAAIATGLERFRNWPGEGRFDPLAQKARRRASRSAVQASLPPQSADVVKVAPTGPDRRANSRPSCRIETVCSSLALLAKRQNAAREIGLRA